MLLSAQINDAAQNQSAETPNTARMEANMFPFAHGPRMCLGNNLVLIVLRLALATITRNFDIVSPPETNEQTMGIRDANVSLVFALLMQRFISCL